MDFSKLTAYADSVLELGVPSIDILVQRDHRQLYRHMAGWRDTEKKHPLRGAETYNL